MSSIKNSIKTGSKTVPARTGIFQFFIRAPLIKFQAYNRDMPDQTIKLWELSQDRGASEINLPDQSSLDAITRQLPQGFYTTFRTYDGGRRVLGLRVHLQRLYQPAASQGILPSVPVKGLRLDLAGFLRSFKEEARVRLILTMEGRVYAAIEPLKTLPPEFYARGVRVVTTGMERQNPRLKSTSFISASQSARAEIAENRIFEALLVRNGYILEGLTSNFFYIRNGTLATAHRNILLGVTRRMVLRLARMSELAIRYQPLKLDLVPDQDESFLTSSSRGIVPIIKIDEDVVGEGVPGPITRRLMKAYQEFILKEAEQI